MPLARSGCWMEQGQVPRGMADPLMPAGSWTFRLLTKDPDWYEVLDNGVVFGHEPKHITDHLIRVWPQEAGIGH